MSSLIAADRVLVPFDCDAFSAEAISQVSQAVEEVACDHNQELTIEGIIINQFQAQARLPKESISRLEDQGYTVLSPYLSSSVVMRESHAEGVPLVYFKPKHKLSKEFSDLAKLLINASRSSNKSLSINTNRKRRSSKQESSKTS